VKKRGLLKGFFLLVIFSLIFSCTNKADDYFPMSDGAKWVYSVEVLSKHTSAQPSLKGEMVVLIDGEETINGKRYYKQASSSTLPGMEQTVVYLRKTKDGVYSAGKEGKKERLELPLPPTVGKTWSAETIYNNQTIHVACRIADKQKLYVLDKKYKDCIKVSRKNITMSTEMVGYYAPNIGLVKATITAPDNIMELTLTEYVQA
jgi:hypothetical protein